jgi:Lrp/AsnC family leucine-responsive transcriptional regulator
MVREIDGYDRKILNILTSDARISLTQLSAKVGLSKTPVAARVKNLEDAGLITSYRAILSTNQLGLSYVAFLQVRLSDTREKTLQEFNAAVKKVPEVAECHMIAGGFDYLLKVRTSDINAYRKVMGQHISTLPHVESTSTFVSMETVVDQTNPPLSLA